MAHHQNKPFFIFAISRSRTTWLSRALTYGKTVCYHDLSACGDIDFMERILKPNRGTADTGIIHFVERMGRFMGCPAIAIHRDPDEGLDSLRAAGWRLDPEIRRQQAQRLWHLGELWGGPVLHVEYEAINASGRHIWRHCIGDGFDQERWDALCAEHIEAPIDRPRIDHIMNRLERHSRSLQ